MKDQHIARLEARLENLIEGAFAHFFGRKVHAQDIALQLARAMENGLRPVEKDDPRPIAPNQYRIHLNPDTATHLLQKQPDLVTLLSQHMVELATSAGYRLDTAPVVEIIAKEDVVTGELEVHAGHAYTNLNSTNLLNRVEIPTSETTPQNPQLIIGNRTVPLQKPLVNIGRGHDNDIMLDDAHVSRHHAQLRLRFGHYTLFDAQSRTGTFVNDVHIQEHPLTSGDVIKMGNTQLVYLEEDESDQTTSQFDPIDLDEA